MSGWSLKEGSIKKILLDDNELWEKHKKFFSKKTVMKNLYKITLYEAILESSLKDEKTNVLNIIAEKFAEKYWDFKNINKFKITMYNGRSYKSSQEINIENIRKKYNLINKSIIFENLIDYAKQDYIIQTKKVLKTNVLGALYNDFDGTIYRFDKKEEVLVLNKCFVCFFKKNFRELKTLIKYRKIELLKQLNNNYMDIKEYFLNNNLEFNKNFYSEIDHKIETFQNICLESIKIKKNRERPMNSKQGFKFEVNYCVLLLENIKNRINTKDGLREITGAGENRIVTFIDWLKYIGSVEGTARNLKLTKLGEAYVKLKESDDYLEPLMLYHLLRNPNLNERDGHYYFSTLVNELFYSIVFDYENTISLEKIKSELFKIGADPKYPTFITSAVTTLTDSQSGFGKMGILEKTHKKGKDEIFEIHSYWIEPLIGAYIIYDMWKDGQTAMEITNIINEKYNLGRMFLMSSDAVKETLLEIQALNLIEIEERAGLNQIRIKKNITKEDILNMIIDEA